MVTGELWKEPFFRCWIEAMDGLIFTLDPQGVVTGCHCPDPRLLPLPADQVVGHSLTKMLPAPAVEAFQVALQTLKNNQHNQQVDYQLEIDGVQRFFRAKVGSLCLQRPPQCPEPAGALVVVWDITTHALSQEARLESEAFHRLLAENSSDVISVLSLDRDILYVSPSVEKLTGYPVEAFQDRAAATLLHPENLIELLSRGSDDDQAQPVGSARFRHRLHHREGRVLWVETDAKLIEWRGQPAVLSTSRDITSRQEAETIAAEMLEELRDARGKAEAANRAKTEFLANISHQLRTPLHGILGMAELFEQTHLTEEQQQYLEAMHDSGEILLTLVNDLQDLSKIDAGQIDLHEGSFDLIEAVEGLSDIMGNQAEAKGISLHCQVASGVPPLVKGDALRLRQVLINLITYAIRATEHGGVDVQVLPGEQGRVRFLVRDTSAGISAEKVRQLEEALAPKEGLRALWSGNLGLGLSIAQKLLGLMGGSMKLTSKLGLGTTFYFDLTLAPGIAETQEVTRGSLEGLRILASDSSPSIRQWMREVLEQAGAEVDLASGSVEVIRTLQEEPEVYNCAVLDASMYDLDGISAVSLLRADPQLAALPVVLTTTSDVTGRLKQVPEANVNALLQKPLRRDVLLQAIWTVIQGGNFVPSELQAGADYTILVVEDNPTNLRLARELLKHAGYQVLDARSGQEALQQFQGHRVDAVLMDIELPDMSGLEAASSIRRVPAGSHIPIIAMTAHAMKGDAERFIEAGLDDYLSKPVNRLELLEVLERVIARRDPDPDRSEPVRPPSHRAPNPRL